MNLINEKFMEKLISILDKNIINNEFMNTINCKRYYDDGTRVLNDLKLFLKKYFQTLLIIECENEESMNKLYGDTIEFLLSGFTKNNIFNIIQNYDTYATLKFHHLIMSNLWEKYFELEDKNNSLE